MIGHTFPHTSAVVLGIAPSGDDDSYIVLCKSKFKDEWITGRVYVRQLPAPEEWDNGTYHWRLDEAVKEWIRRSCLANDDDGLKWLVRLIQNTEKALDAQKEDA